MRPNKIAVVGPGVVGMPIAAALASTPGNDGSPPPRVVVLQRPSGNSAWKVRAINEGRSPIGGVEPGLDRLVAECVTRGTLSASADPLECSDAQATLLCVRTDRVGLVPEHGPLLEALENLAVALRSRPPASRPLVVIESTLAPSAMQSIVRPLLERRGLEDGRDLLLAYSPSRVRQGSLLDDVARATRIVSGLHPESPLAAAALYRRVVTRGRILVTNSLTAEVVRTLENAWHDVRLAFGAEIARYCDRVDVDYLTLRDQVNDRLAWPDGVAREDGHAGAEALPAPSFGVGGQCLPRDGILLWWRALEAGHVSRNSIILAARAVNDATPAATVRLARLELGSVSGRRVTVLGAAASANADDTRNSPGLVLASLLRDSGADVMVHDPFVVPDDTNLARFELTDAFTNDVERALDGRTLVFLATAHDAYRGLLGRMREHSSGIEGVVDGCHLFQGSDFAGAAARYAGIGQGRRAPDGRLVRSVASMYRAIARGVANEVDALVRFLNARYAQDAFNRVDFEEVRRLAATSPRGCVIDRPGDLAPVEAYDGFVSGLAQLALDAHAARVPDPRRGPLEHVPPGLWFGNEDALVADDTPWPLTPRP